MHKRPHTQTLVRTTHGGVSDVSPLLFVGRVLLVLLACALRCCGLLDFLDGTVQLVFQTGPQLFGDLPIGGVKSVCDVVLLHPARDSVAYPSSILELGIEFELWMVLHDNDRDGAPSKHRLSVNLCVRCV